MDDKVAEILKLISEKSRGLQEELDGTMDEEIRIELIGQISILDETYSEVELISKQSD
jgi:hypothetical protein